VGLDRDTPAAFGLAQQRNDTPVLGDQTALEAMIDDAAQHGSVAVVIDMTA